MELSERIGDRAHGATLMECEQWAEEVRLKDEYIAQLEAENEKLRELKNFCYAEAQTQGDGRDFSLAAYMLRDLPTTKRAELTELCQAMSNKTASKSDWEGLKQWWLEAALKGDDTMTWLDEIEQHECEMRERFPQASSRLTYVERMARVIRELGTYIKASHAVEEACLDFNPANIKELREARKQAWDDMSDDAKELLK